MGAMKNTALLFSLLVLCLPALAQEQAADTGNNEEFNQTCILGKAETGDTGNYRPCKAEPRNNDLIDQGFSSARLDRQTLKNTDALWLHGVCKFVDNRSTDSDFFIPFRSADEWKAFLRNMPKMMVAYGCCMPRQLEARDVVTPTQRCEGGWRLQGVVDNNNLTSPLMNLAGISFVGVDGEPVELPLIRDDASTYFEYQGQKEFAARFRCSDGSAGDTGLPVDEHGEDDITIIGEAPPATPGEEGHVPFRVRCNRGEWNTVSLRPCAESQYEYSASCEAYGYPPGTRGAVRILVRTICPSEEKVEEVLEKDCTAK
jgi:hypothetical protein